MHGRTAGFSRFLNLSVFFLFTALPQISAAASDEALPNFARVDANVYRGGRPSVDGLKQLRDLGIRTILNLENDDKAITAEIREAKKLGIEVISIPLNDKWFMKDPPVNAALKVVASTRAQPLYIHCHYGKNRTGLVVGLHRVEQQGWEPERAYAEMKELGFQSWILFVSRYFKKRVGL